MSRGRRALLALVALLTLGALWLALRGPAGGEAPDGTAPMPRMASPTPPRMPSPIPSEAPSAEPERVPSDVPSETSSKAPAGRPETIGPVEAYRRYAVYPPDSRPLAPEQTDLIDWNRRHESPRTDPDDPEVTALFTADRFHLVGDETLSPVLDVRRGGEPAAVQVLEATVSLPDGRAVPYALEPRGGVFAGLIRPADFGLDAPARLAVRVAFDAGAGRREARLFAHYTPEAAVPARFAEVLGDRVADGGLLVEVAVEVETPGLYLIDANLWAAGEPVGWTRVKRHLDPGRQVVGLRFFGKVIADAGRDGPYTVEQLRGALAAPDRMPSTVQMPPFAGAITTGAYAAADFSAAAWDAPEKRDRLARLRRLEAMGGPQVPTPVAPPR